MAIDLHVHSTASDGRRSPAGVVAAAAAAGLDVVALTDHDTTAGWAQADAAGAAVGVRVVPGVEISCQVGGISVHLLAYLPAGDDAALAAEWERTRGSRRGRARRMVERIGEDYPLTWHDVLAQVSGGSEGATVGRPHIADALVARGVVRDRDEAFATVLRAGTPYYLGYDAPDAARMVALVRRAGGVPVMAHPRARRRGRVVPDTAVADLAAAGLAGLEVDHRDHEEADRRQLRALAAELGLFTTGASDYHGDGKPNVLGENTTDPEVLERILATGTGSALLGAG